MIAKNQFARPKPWEFCAAILSGGQSERMGVPKAGLLLPDGRSMIERMRDTLTVFCRQVVFVGPAYGVLGHQTIETEEDMIGPLGALEALLSSNVDTQYLIVPCDLPLAPPAFLARLTRDEKIDGMTTFHVDGEDASRPLPCRISSDCLDDVRDLISEGERSLHALIKRLGPDAEIAPVAHRERELLLNVNTPEDFERACGALRKE